MKDSIYDSPALKLQSQYYPSAWQGKVPKKVRMLECVKSELPFPLFLVVYEGEEYLVWVNSHGAVSAILESGQLGLKPNEFEIIEWHSPQGGNPQ